MSKSIVKQTLHSFNCEIESDDDEKAVTKKKKRKTKHHTAIPVQNLKMKYILDDFKKQSAVDLTNENLSFLEKLKSSSTEMVEKSAVNKIVDQQRGRLSKDHSKVSRRSRLKQTSMFTEEDFKKFEEEYFVQW